MPREGAHSGLRAVIRETTEKTTIPNDKSTSTPGRSLASLLWSAIHLSIRGHGALVRFPAQSASADSLNSFHVYRQLEKTFHHIGLTWRLADAHMVY